MLEPTLAEILGILVDAIDELIESLKREAMEQGLIKLQANSQMKDFETDKWSPPKSNEDTTNSHLGALSVANLDDWAEQNKAEVERLLFP